MTFGSMCCAGRFKVAQCRQDKSHDKDIPCTNECKEPFNDCTVQSCRDECHSREGLKKLHGRKSPAHDSSVQKLGGNGSSMSKACNLDSSGHWQDKSPRSFSFGPFLPLYHSSLVQVLYCAVVKCWFGGPSIRETAEQPTANIHASQHQHFPPAMKCLRTVRVESICNQIDIESSPPDQGTSHRLAPVKLVTRYDHRRALVSS